NLFQAMKETVSTENIDLTDEVRQLLGENESKQLTFTESNQLINGSQKNSNYILIIDDDLLNLQIIHYLLEANGFQVKSIDDPLQAIQEIEHGACDLIICDVMMPSISCFELTKRIRERFSPVELPILLLTARTRQEDIMNGLQLGAN